MEITEAQALQRERDARPPDRAGCWFDVGTGVGIARKPAVAVAVANESAARALRHLLSRGLTATGTAGTAAQALRTHPAANAYRKPVRSTFPGTTPFKVLCNSYLRKLLRGAAPDAVYWVAQATLPDGDRILARLRLTFVVEDVRVEKAPAAPVIANAEHEPAPAAPGGADGAGQTDGIRELG